MKQKLLFPILALLLFAVGCVVYSVVSSDKDDTADFTKYKTYAWLPDKDKTVCASKSTSSPSRKPVFSESTVSNDCPVGKIQ